MPPVAIGASIDVMVCQHCGELVDLPPHPHDLRPMPELQGEADQVPLAIICPRCDGVVRITYPSHITPRDSR